MDVEAKHLPLPVWQKATHARAYLDLKVDVDRTLDREERQADRHVCALRDRVFGACSVQRVAATLTGVHARRGRRLHRARR
jgi:hypothetical protein